MDPERGPDLGAIMTVWRSWPGFHEQFAPAQVRCNAVAIGKYLWLQLIGFFGSAVGVIFLVFVPLPIP